MAHTLKRKTETPPVQPVTEVNPAVARAAIELAKGRDVHIEIEDENTVYIRNGKR